ncbi:MAG: hypothetical protein ACLUEJ_14560 [Clostridium sp.]
MSERALLETMAGAAQKRLAGCERLILRRAIMDCILRDHLGIELDQAVKCSNFIEIP